MLPANIGREHFSEGEHRWRSHIVYGFCRNIVCAKHNTVCRKATSFCVRIRTMMLTASGQMMLRVNSQTMLYPADTNTKISTFQKGSASDYGQTC